MKKNFTSTSVTGLKKNTMPIIVAHRGASHMAPENTIPAFKLAWTQNADAVEGDFHLTRDGEIVCLHDNSIKEISGRKKTIKTSTLKELKNIDIGSFFAEQWKGTKIPTLYEVLETVPKGKKIYIEVKCGPEILPKLFEEIKKSGLKNEQIVIIALDSKVIYNSKIQAPSIKALWLSAFKKDKSGNLSPSPEKVLKTLRHIHADGFSSHAHEEIDNSFAKKILNNGYEYHVWTIDDLKTAEKFKKLGVMSITTNTPGALKKNLIEQPAASGLKTLT